MVHVPHEMKDLEDRTTPDERTGGSHKYATTRLHWFEQLATDEVETALKEFLVGRRMLDSLSIVWNQNGRNPNCQSHNIRANSRRGRRRISTGNMRQLLEK
ncbi:predicted protein [Histoplasma capsulatum var. duboisii H88]|uniref:Predicted protein n=1 Tax=Ajellomyces capsulatus (strain H88) TaxID=544711 RepID=F0UQ53_AJEC8|nr:predicted protein [Histoplasma capsulatum var. duboisii H88]